MKIIADAAEVSRLIDRLAADIAAGSPDPRSLGLIGIRRRGDVLATRVGERLELPVSQVGSIDITLYRDDLSETGPMARVGKTHIPFSVQGREVVLLDDVVMTGRSVLAALREILDFGRPSRIWLAVLAERPEREIPLQPEYAALRLRPGPGEKIDVRLKPQDQIDQVAINTRG
jgi:pyrimidine operon attenuation protein/uracil phosphoribosyltransferase